MLRSCITRVLVASFLYFLPSAEMTVAQDIETKKDRMALIIGNSNYQHAPVLSNAVNDAEDIASTLGRIGYRVTLATDLTLPETQRIIREAIQNSENAASILFYYAGHGVQVDGENYLLPIDADIQGAADLEFGAFRLDPIISHFNHTTSTTILILDACRNNPFVQALGGTRSTLIGRGLARVFGGLETFIAFSTQPDNESLDGEGRNSPFTAALLKHVATPGLELRQLMMRVRRDVASATKGQQVPWEHSALTQEYYFVPPAAAIIEARLHSPPRGSLDPEVMFWATVQSMTDPDTIGAALQLYLQTFPEGYFADLARLQLQKLTVIKQNAPTSSSLVNLAPTRVHDLVVWNEIHDDGEPALLHEYLAHFPDGAFADEAKARLRQAGEIASIVGSASEQTAEPATRRVTVFAGTGPQPIHLRTATGAWQASLATSEVETFTVRETPRGLLTTIDERTVLPGEVLRASGGLHLLFEPLAGEEGKMGRLVFNAAAEGGEWASKEIIEISVEVDDCDALASDPLAPDRVAPGFWFLDRSQTTEEEARLRGHAAVLACLAAVDRWPNVARFRALLGRAYIGIKAYDKALAVLEPAAETGNASVLNALGLIHKNGWSVSQNDERAASYYLKAAQAGHASAQYNIGLLHRDGRGGLAEDIGQAVLWLERSAESGFHWAHYQLGRLYQEGRGVERNPSKAAAYLRLAMEKRNGSAAFQLARLYEKGEGVPKDPSTAAELYRKAVAAGDGEEARAALALASLYETGRGVAYDPVEALMLSLQALQGDRETISAEASRQLSTFPQEVRVRALQRMLRRAEYDPGPEDGTWGQKTAAALQAFAKAHGLEHTFADVPINLLHSIAQVLDRVAEEKH